MESTSRGGTGPVLPSGNTLQARPGARPEASSAVRPLPAPVGAHQVTRMPLPQGRCTGRYTDEARQAGLEGTVILDLVVGEDGRVRQVKVVKGLGGGLTEAAMAAVKGCRFSPGERDGRPVAVKLRGFKIRFFLQGGD
jgi:protein TonB